MLGILAFALACRVRRIATLRRLIEQYYDERLDAGDSLDEIEAKLHQLLIRSRATRGD